jgi:hypothetical protein
MAKLETLHLEVQHVKENRTALTNAISSTPTRTEVDDMTSSILHLPRWKTRLFPCLGKGKVVPVLNYLSPHEDMWGNGGIDPSTGGWVNHRSGQGHAENKKISCH